VVPLDGFHLQDEELVRLGRLGRKGAPDTSDRGRLQSPCCAIAARRPIGRSTHRRSTGREVSLAGAIAVLPQHRLVVTEGKLPAPGRARLAGRARRARGVLVPRARRRDPPGTPGGPARWARAQPEAGAEWVERTDEPNARLVERGRHRADLLVEPADWMTSLSADVSCRRRLGRTTRPRSRRCRCAPGARRTKGPCRPSSSTPWSGRRWRRLARRDDPSNRMPATGCSLSHTGPGSR